MELLMLRDLQAMRECGAAPIEACRDLAVSWFMPEPYLDRFRERRSGRREGQKRRVEKSVYQCLLKKQCTWIQC